MNTITTEIHNILTQRARSAINRQKSTIPVIGADVIFAADPKAKGFFLHMVAKRDNTLFFINEFIGDTFKDACGTLKDTRFWKNVL